MKSFLRLFGLVLWDIRGNKDSPNFDAPTVFILLMRLWILMYYKLVAMLCIFLIVSFKYSFRKWQVELILFLSFFSVWKVSAKLIAFTWKCKTCSLNVTRSCANHLNTFEIYLLRNWQMFHSLPQSLIFDIHLTLKEIKYFFPHINKTHKLFFLSANLFVGLISFMNLFVNFPLVVIA